MMIDSSGYEHEIDNSIPLEFGPPIETFRPEDGTDAAAADKFSEFCGEYFRYVFEWKSWLKWDTSRWVKVEMPIVMEAARKVGEYYFSLAGRLESEDAQKFCVSFAKRCHNTNGMTQFLKQAEGLLSISIKDLNSDPWLLNCLNGTIDLKTGQLRAHNRCDYLTVICSVNYPKQTSGNVWTDFLGSTFSDHPDLIPYLQRLLGSSLAGIQKDHILPVFWGVGANGKSVLLNAVINTIGDDYAMQAIPDFLMETKNDKSHSERADLYGKRFVACIETEQGRRLQESLVKSLTGGDRIRARRLYENFFEFTPSHTIVMATNHKPRVTGDDNGIWRRLRFIPFTKIFTGDQCDADLPQKLEQGKADILHWLVAGCLEWQKQGLNDPEIVTQETRKHRDESDVIGQFIKSCCVSDEGAVIEFRQFYTAFEQWCKETGDDIPSKKRVGSYLKERYKEDTRSRQRIYQGLKVNT